MSQFSYLTCPSQVSSNFNVNLKCEPMEIFKPKMYDVPEIFGLKIVSYNGAALILFNTYYININLVRLLLHKNEATIVGYVQNTKSKTNNLIKTRS